MLRAIRGLGTAFMKFAANDFLIAALASGEAFTDRPMLC
jgi:hypothetical protein